MLDSNTIIIIEVSTENCFWVHFVLFSHIAVLISSVPSKTDIFGLHYGHDCLGCAITYKLKVSILRNPFILKRLSHFFPLEGQIILVISKSAEKCFVLKFCVK